MRIVSKNMTCKILTTTQKFELCSRILYTYKHCTLLYTGDNGKASVYISELVTAVMVCCPCPCPVRQYWYCKL